MDDFGGNGPTVQVPNCAPAPRDGFILPQGTTVVMASNAPLATRFTVGYGGYPIDENGQNPFACPVNMVLATGRGEALLTLPPPMMQFTGTGGVAFDFNQDGQPDSATSTCADTVLLQCGATMPAHPLRRHGSRVFKSSDGKGELTRDEERPQRSVQTRVCSDNYLLQGLTDCVPPLSGEIVTVRSRHGSCVALARANNVQRTSLMTDLLQVTPMPDERACAPAAQLAILFADISSSSLIYAERGDKVALSLTRMCLKLMNEQVQQAGGRVVKRVGNGILAVFDTPAAALTAAVGIQEALNQPDSVLRREGIHVRVGISCGRTLLVGDDVFGDVVNVAARLASYAGPDQILLSGHAYEELPAALRESARLIDQVVLRGRPSWVLVYQHLWKREDATAVTARERVSSATLNVTYGSRLFVVGSEHPRLRIGRAPDNDISIERNLVSRYHAEISLRGDKFFLSDLSTNGTYLCLEGDERLRVSREDVTLGASGRIFVGSETAEPIRFTWRSKRTLAVPQAGANTPLRSGRPLDETHKLVGG